MMGESACKYYGVVSIIMPSYNSSSTIGRSINSVIEQTYPYWELIIVDDNSTDNTSVIVNGMHDSRIKLIPLQKNSGSPVTPRNVAIERATGDYIAFLDSDDFWLPNKLSLQLSIMHEKNSLVCHGSYYRCQGEKRSLTQAKNLVDYKSMLSSNKIGNLTGIYNCKVIGKVFQEHIGHEDYLMWLNILRGRFSVGISEPIACYTVSLNSVSSNKIKSAIWHFKILKNHAKLSYGSLFFMFVAYVFNAVKNRL